MAICGGDEIRGFFPDIAPTTGGRGWLTLAEFDVAGREDHRYILRDIEKEIEGIIPIRLLEKIPVLPTRWLAQAARI